MKIYYGSKPKLSEKDMKSFNRGKYTCKALLQTGKGEPVIISKCDNTEFPAWKVEYNYSCVVFNTYDEALAFCKGRFLGLDGKAV
jgi:hypothetical protein